MIARIALAVAAIAMIAGAARADDAAPQAPWMVAQSLVAKAEEGIQTRGILGIKPYVDDMDDALSHAPDAIAQAASGTQMVVFTDGAADTLEAMMAASVNRKSAQAVPNPYTRLSFYLGSYYNEVGQPDRALQALDEGLAATSAVGEHRPMLYSERGAALESLKRWQDALDDFNTGLKINGLDPQMHALLLRGRGFSLTELNQLDDAEAAYRESLTYEPGNQRAQSELEYIAKLRAGAPKAPAAITPVQPASGEPAPPSGP